MRYLVIDKCVNCPCCNMNDFTEGYSCKLFNKLTGKYSEIIKEDVYFTTIPEWCPIKNGNLTLTSEEK